MVEIRAEPAYVVVAAPFAEAVQVPVVVVPGIVGYVVVEPFVAAAPGFVGYVAVELFAVAAPAPAFSGVAESVAIAVHVAVAFFPVVVRVAVQHGCFQLRDFAQPCLVAYLEQDY